MRAIDQQVLTDAWAQIPSAEVLRAHLQKQLDELLWCRFGYHLLALGPFAQALNYELSPTRTHCVLGRQASGILADEHSLPVRTDSIDVLVLPLVLDFCAEPHRILREAQRVLMGDGHLIIQGFNPMSFWGLRRYLGRRNRPLWRSRFLRQQRLLDWLQLLGFEMTEISHTFHKPPLNSERWLQRLEFMEKAGQRYWPSSGACYTLCAQKRDIPITPVKLRRPRLIGLPVRMPQPSRREQAA